MSDDDDNNKGQEDLIARIEKAIHVCTENWDLTPVDVCGCLRVVQHNYLNAVDAVEDDDE